MKGRLDSFLKYGEQKACNSFSQDYERDQCWMNETTPKAEGQNKEKSGSRWQQRTIESSFS